MKVKSIFLADDDFDDIELFQEALEEVCNSCTLVSSKDGIDLLNKLSGPAANLPQVMFIDVNMPLMNGLECLEQIKRQDSLKNIPVVILTTSASPTTIERAYSLGANLFVEKPFEFHQLKTMIGKVMKMDWSNYASPEIEGFVYKAS